MKYAWAIRRPRVEKSGYAIGILASAVMITLTGCAHSKVIPATEAAQKASCSSNLNSLTLEAKKEGQVTVLGMSDSWANTGKILQSFQAKYGIKVNSIYPDASSADELTLLRTWLVNPRRPDVAEISTLAAATADSQHLLATYQGSAWKLIPETAKSENGSWTASYVGAMSFGVNHDVLPANPKSWQDLKGVKYRNAVTLKGDPRESATAMGAVIAASLASGGSFEDAKPGIAYFAELSRIGNLNQVPLTQLNVIYGDVPVGLSWNFVFEGLNESIAANGVALDIGVPSDGIVGLPYAQVISARSTHPCAARLLVEYLNGPEAAVQRINAGAIPTAHWKDAANDPRTAEIVSALLAGGVQSHIPSVEQLAVMQEQIDQEWGSQVSRVKTEAGYAN